MGFNFKNRNIINNMVSRWTKESKRKNNNEI